MYLAELLQQVAPAFGELGFTGGEGGVFTAGEATVRVAYNDETTLFELFYTPQGGQEHSLSTFLFDATQTADDVEAVAIDFVDSLRRALGKKGSRKESSIELPKAGNGETATLSDLMQKLLAIFPQHKETYKIHMADYGRLLTVDFCHRYFIPSIRELAAAGNKKTIKKFLDAMTGLYVSADAATVPYVVSLLAVGVGNTPEGLELIRSGTADCPSLYTAVVNFANTYKHNKKLQERF